MFHRGIHDASLGRAREKISGKRRKNSGRTKRSRRSNAQVSLDNADAVIEGALLKLITFPLSVLNFGIFWLVINTPMLKRRITYHGGFQYAQHNVGPCSRSNRVF